MAFFSIPRIQEAIEHLSHFDEKWIIVPWVLAANGIDSTGVRVANNPGADSLLRKVFAGSLIGLPPIKPTEPGKNLLRPRFGGVPVKQAGDYVVQSSHAYWGNLMSSRGYREMRQGGYLGGSESNFVLNPTFYAQLSQKLNGFHYEELLVWLFAFDHQGFSSTSWVDLQAELAARLFAGRHFPAEYLPFFEVDPTGARVPWRASDVLPNRPLDTDFITQLYPSWTPVPVNTPLLPQGAVTPPPRPAIVAPVTGGENVMICGAPGVGKSNKVKEAFTEEQIERTVFHPETTYHDFVGSYQPTMISSSQRQRVGYAFVPGPFTRVLIKALNYPANLYVLVIEEISRAPAAAVFGEIFQLLDRQPDGKSEYAILIPEHLSNYLANEVKTWVKGEKLTLPSNLSIYATMNPADQGVQRLDTAFKRRWRWDYIPIDFDTCAFKDKTLFVGSRQVAWKILGTALNTVLKSKTRIPEDRLLGPHFLREADLQDKEAIAGGLLHYLWDDVLRHQEKTVLFNAGANATFSDIVAAYLADKDIFSKDVTDEIGRLEASAP